MERIDISEVERRIGYWQHILGKLERNMLKEQSERLSIKHKLVHLQRLQYQVKLTVF